MNLSGKKSWWQEICIVKEDARMRPETSEVERLWASNEKARKLLRWEPQFGAGGA